MKCKICSETTEKLIDKQFNQIYHRCPNCEFIFLDEEYYLTHTEEKEQYDYHNNSIEDDGYVNFLMNYLDKGVFPFVKNGNVLEFGSGPTPVLSELLERYEYNVTKYDLHYYNDESYLNNKYDAITSTEVFEHLKEPYKILKNLLNLLKAGGIVSIMTLSIPEDLEDFQTWWYRRDTTHICFFNEVTFKHLATLLGAELIYSDERIFVLKKGIKNE